MRNKLVIVILLCVIGFFGYRYSPYVTQYLISYGYEYPKEGENFNIYVDAGCPLFLTKILERAFDDREVHFTSNQENQPINLIVTSVFFKKKLSANAPVIMFSGESDNINSRNIINGIPFVMFLSTIPRNNKEFYFPFIAWSDIKPERFFTNTGRAKFLAYVNSKCKKHRDKFFALIKERRGDAEALGKCSNTIKNKVVPRSSGWHSLPEVFSEYNFVFAMENNKVHGYVTEKIMMAFNGGAIPIYWGDSEMVSKWFNKKAYIDVSDFKTPEEAADYIVALSYDQKRIEEMQREPIFKDGIVPDLFKLDEDNNPLIEEAAKRVRQEYFKALERDRKNPIKASWFSFLKKK